MNSEKEKIEKLRDNIDRVDKKITQLLNQRAGFAIKIGEIKRHYKMPVYVPEREKTVIENVCRANPGPLSGEAMTRLYERIIDESRRLEREHADAKKSND